MQIQDTEEGVMFPETMGDIAHHARGKVDLGHIAIVALDEGDARAVWGPVGALAIAQQLGMKRRGIVEHVRL
jgi:hypothetical protein